jgi:LPS O-antigen subunit length determinant protein (WzzB/FepE family)
MKDSMSEEEIRLDKYLRAVWRAKWLIALAIILAAGITAYLASAQPTLHKATALIKIGRVWKEPLEDPYITEKIINSPGFLKELAQKMGLSAARLKRSVKAETVIAGPRRSRYPILVSVTATAETSDDAVRFARAVADEVSARHNLAFDEAMKLRIEQERRLEEFHKELAAQGAAARDSLLRTESELNEVRASNSLANPNVTERTRLVEEIEPERDVRPEVWRKVAAAAMIAAVVSVAAAVLIGHFTPAQKRAAAE